MEISYTSYLVSAAILFLIYGIYLFLLKKHRPENVKTSAKMLFVIGIIETQFLPVMYDFAKDAFIYKSWSLLIFPTFMLAISISYFMNIVKKDQWNLSTKFKLDNPKIGKRILYIIVILPILIMVFTLLMNSNQPPLWFVITVLLVAVLMAALGYTAIFKEETIGKINRKLNDFDEESDPKNEAEENERR